jgi:hypothetical protein
VGYSPKMLELVERLLSLSQMGRANVKIEIESAEGDFTKQELTQLGQFFRQSHGVAYQKLRLDSLKGDNKNAR